MNVIVFIFSSNECGVTIGGVMMIHKKLIEFNKNEWAA